MTDGPGFDVVFDATCHHSGPGIALDHVREGGQVVVGIPNESSDLAFTAAVRGEIEVDTAHGSLWRNFEQALRSMAAGDVDVDAIVDTNYSADDPAAAFEAFLDSETCKPVFRFAD